MPDFWTMIGGGGIVIGVIGLISAGLQKWLPQRGSLEHQLIDQLQEQVKALADRVAALEARGEQREAYIRRLEKRDRAWSLWHNALLIGIAAGTIPPVLDLPTELLEEL